MYKYKYIEAIDELYIDNDGNEQCEYGYNELDFTDKTVLLQYIKDNPTHWSTSVITNDKEFALLYDAEYDNNL